MQILLYRAVYKSPNLSMSMWICIAVMNMYDMGGVVCKYL